MNKFFKTSGFKLFGRDIMIEKSIMFAWGIGGWDWEYVGDCCSDIKHELEFQEIEYNDTKLLECKDPIGFIHPYLVFKIRASGPGHFMFFATKEDAEFYKIYNGDKDIPFAREQFYYDDEKSKL